MNLELDTAEWLLSGSADEALGECAHSAATPALISRLRRQLEKPERAAAVVELAELRRRGREKFAAADRMFFTRKALEQATDEWIARHKAKRFARGSVVMDACCGIGGDLAALAAGTSVTGIDAEPVLALFAGHNTRVVGADAQTMCEALQRDGFPECDAWHADPDRRPAGKRTSQPDLHEPSLETLATWCAQVPNAVIKFAPAARLPQGWQDRSELEWISRAGECKQLVAWGGSLAKEPGTRVATHLDSTGEAASFTGDPRCPWPTTDALGDWIHEPDPAILASDLTGAFARARELAAVTPAVPYLTSDQRFDEPLVASFRVVDAMALDRKRLTAWLHERRVGRLEIKCRGVEIRPERLRRDLKPRGDGSMTLLVYPDRDRKTRVVIAERA